MSTMPPVCAYVDTYKMPSKQKTQVPSTPAATTTPAPCCLLLNRGHILVLLASLRLRPSSPSPRLARLSTKIHSDILPQFFLHGPLLLFVLCALGVGRSAAWASRAASAGSGLSAEGGSPAISLSAMLIGLFGLDGMWTFSESAIELLKLQLWSCSAVVSRVNGFLTYYLSFFFRCLVVNRFIVWDTIYL